MALGFDTANENENENEKVTDQLITRGGATAYKNVPGTDVKGLFFSGLA